MEITVTTDLSRAEFDLFQSIGGDTPHNRNRFLSTLLHTALARRIKWLTAFQSRIDKEGAIPPNHTTPCWLWTGGKLPNGYGVTRHPDTGKSVLAHRMAYELVRGPIPAGMIILHSCDNPICVNPEHHSVGTHKENSADMYAKGRQNSTQMRPKGAGHYKARLTQTQVSEIRTAYLAGGITIKELALRFNVGAATIHGVLSGKTWATKSDQSIQPESIPTS